ncbi:hypothetical protein BH24CHL5_BH24CHL5_11980 [soil metagenome]
MAALATGVLASAAIAEDGDKSFRWPTTGRITQNYGCTGFWAEPRRGSCAHFHGGIDIANDRGTPIRAAADGVIAHVGLDPWLPNRIASWMVIINHGSGIQTMYAHLRDKAIDGIRPGARVTQGQIIGLMDSTGLSTGPHLHFSFIKNGTWANPRNYIAGKPVRLRPIGSTTVEPSCATFWGGFGAWTGGPVARATEKDGPSPCSA